MREGGEERTLARAGLPSSLEVDSRKSTSCDSNEERGYLALRRMR